MKLSDVLSRVIALGDKVRAYYDAELPKYHVNYPLVGPDETEPPPPPEEKELADYLNGLPTDMVYRLALVVALGHGLARADDLAEYYSAIKDHVGDRAEAIADMMWFKYSLSNILTFALETLDRQGIGVDELPPKKVKARKR